MTLTRLEKILLWLDSESRGLWLWLDKNDSDTSLHWPYEEWYRGRMQFGLEQRYALCYTLCVDLWIANKEGQGPGAILTQDFRSVMEKMFVFLIFLRTVVFNLEVASPTDGVNNLWKGCQMTFYVGLHSCITFVLSEFRWGSLGYSGLLQWVALQKGLKTTGLNASVKITSDVWTHSPQYFCTA